MFLRALLAFLALPGVLAFALPLTLFRPSPLPTEISWPGVIVLAIGLAVLGLCVREFYVVGKGTLAPWSPPKHLVVTGLYRYSRNPMYVGVLCIVLGWALLFESRSLAMYAAGLALLFHLRVIINEEPFLARTHGDAWRSYSASVRRWIW